MADLPTYSEEDLNLAEANKLFTLNHEVGNIADV